MDILIEEQERAERIAEREAYLDRLEYLLDINVVTPDSLSDRDASALVERWSS